MPGRTSPSRNRPTHPCDAFQNGEFLQWRDHVLDLDIEVIFAAAIAENVNRLLQDRRTEGETLRSIAARTGVGSTTLSALSRCQVYPMVGSVVRLEQEYRVAIWPGRQVAQVLAAAWKDQAKDG